MLALPLHGEEERGMAMTADENCTFNNIMSMKKHQKIFLIVIILVVVVRAFAQNVRVKMVGEVVDEKGNPIAGVVVNDGVNFTLTDEKGRWSLPTDTAVSKFISISVPSEYELPQRDGLADGFYIPAVKALKGGNVFHLKHRKRRVKAFTYIAISDPQVLNDDELRRWTKETIVDLKAVAEDKGRKREVIGMTLGDLVFDNMPLYGPYKESMKNLGMTVFQCIGNHDFDRRYADLHRVEYGSSTYGEMRYNEYFGPTDYSFNIGDVHVVTMKNIDYRGKGRYVEALTDEQLEWLRKDLSLVPSDKVVFLNMHAAGWNTLENEGNVRNADKLAEILAGHDTHVFCGHTHFSQNVIVSPRLYQHNIGAACGAWWAGDVNRCGSPNGFLIVDVKGKKVKWHYKPTGAAVDNQFRVYLPGIFRGQEGYVVANVWDYDDDCQVSWEEDGVKRGAMERFTATDQRYYDQLKNHDGETAKTSHLFRATPSQGWKKLRITFTNRFGERYTQIFKR